MFGLGCGALIGTLLGIFNKFWITSVIARGEPALRFGPMIFSSEAKGQPGEANGATFRLPRFL